MAGEKTGINWGSFAASAAGSAASGILSIFNQMYQRKTDRLNAQRQNVYNREMAEYQYNKDLEMWNRANEYNLPGNQMARLKEAGLNPNLIYGGAPSNAAVGQLPKYNAPEWVPEQVAPMNLAQVLDAYQNFEMKQAQIDNLKAERRVIDKRALLTAYQAQNEEYRIGPNWYKDAEARAYLKRLFGTDATNTMDVSPLVNRKIDAEYRSKVAMLERYNADIALKNVDKDIKDLNLQYMRWGSPAWNAIINGARLLIR